MTKAEIDAYTQASIEKAKELKEAGVVIKRARIRARDRSSLEKFIKTKEQADNLMAQLLALSGKG